MNRLLLILLTAGFWSSALHAATFTVTKTQDSGPGSLRQAILDANATPGADTILFNITGSGVKTIRPLSALPTVVGPVTINGYSQSDAEPNTLATGSNAKLRIKLDGSAAGDNVNGLVLSGSDVVVRGLVINQFAGRGIVVAESASAVIIAGNLVGIDATGKLDAGNASGGIYLFRCSSIYIGGTTPADRNVISGNRAGIELSDAPSNKIQGNYIGLNANGTAAVGNAGDGVTLGSAFGGTNGNLIGGMEAAARNVISGNGGTGVQLYGDSNNSIQGNYIGTNAAGMAAVPNAIGIGAGGNPGVYNALVGGPGAGAGNVISGNTGRGISFGDNHPGLMTIQGNLIGVARDGTTPLGNGGTGIHVGYYTGGFFGGGPTIIGGEKSGEPNVIANNGGAGVAVSCCSGRPTRVTRNSIYGNGGLGIELGPTDGANPNDEGDEDDGPNVQQNYPVISSAVISGSSVMIKGTLNSIPSSPFRLEFFGNKAADGSGFGEGQFFLGGVDVTTNAAGNATFEAPFPVLADVDTFSATATDGAGNTSEFSPTMRVRLLNISTRLRVQPGDRALIGGFIVSGHDEKRVLIRGLGPSLPETIADRLNDPTLELIVPGVGSIANDNWRDTQEGEITATTIPPEKNLESAIVATLQPGAYTAILRDKGDQPGVGLVEVFDLNPTSGSELANISTRGFVETGDDVMIGGFIVGPSDLGKLRVIVRAIGPSLADLGVTEPLLDPRLTLFDRNGVAIGSNNNWRTGGQRAEIIATGIPPEHDAEAALVATLDPGPYTAIVRGVNDSTGVALVEIFALD